MPTTLQTEAQATATFLRQLAEHLGASDMPGQAGNCMQRAHALTLAIAGAVPEFVAVIFHKHMSGHSYGVARLIAGPDGITRAIEFRHKDFAYSAERFSNKKAACAFAAARAAELGAFVHPELLVESIGHSALAVIPKAVRDARNAGVQAPAVETEA